MITLRTLVFIVVVSSLAACRPMSLYFVDPKGPPDYKLGWEDGCDSSLGAHGSGVGKMIYGFKKRPEMFENALYNAGWNEGFSYCRASVDPVDKGQWYN